MTFLRYFLAEIRREWVEEKAWVDMLVALGGGCFFSLVLWWLL